MRIIFLLIAAYAITNSPAMAAAEWREYLYPDDSFAIQFPAEPSMRTAPYESIVVPGLTANVYSLEFENILFEATVVDLDGIEGHGTNLNNEAAYNLQRLGNVIFHDFPRVDNREDATFGHTMVVDAQDGRRIRTSTYFSNGRFYRVDAIVLPARGDLDQAFPSRFDQTVRFNIE